MAAVTQLIRISAVEERAATPTARATISALIPAASTSGAGCTWQLSSAKARAALRGYDASGALDRCPACIVFAAESKLITPHECSGSCMCVSAWLQ